jgi:hypothetical protein
MTTWFRFERYCSRSLGFIHISCTTNTSVPPYIHAFVCFDRKQHVKSSINVCVCVLYAACPPALRSMRD